MTFDVGDLVATVERLVARRRRPDASIAERDSSVRPRDHTAGDVDRLLEGLEREW